MRGGEFQVELACEFFADFLGNSGFRHNDLHYSPFNRPRQQKIGLLTDDWNGPRSANQERMLLIINGRPRSANGPPPQRLAGAADFKNPRAPARRSAGRMTS